LKTPTSTFDFFSVRQTPPPPPPPHGFIPSIHVSLESKILIRHIPLGFYFIFDGTKSCNMRMKPNLLAPS